MASAPQASLPLFYKDVAPLNTRDHAAWRARSTDRAPWAATQNAVPLTVDEFVPAQRSFPIVFSAGANPVPLALMGLNEGVNVFFDADGQALEDFYVPAYLRRYPFLLAKLRPDTEEMSLCFDPKSELVGPFDDGNPLFEGDKPSQTTQELLQFCQQFEEAGARTQQFVAELTKHELLMDGEVTIQRGQDTSNPFIFRGFQIVNQEKLREVRGDVLRGWTQNGLLPIIFAHLFSLDLMRVVFGKADQQGKAPSADANQAQIPTDAAAQN